MTQRLDHDRYTADETTIIKIPYNLPYQAEGNNFMRMTGEFEHGGEFYKLVKQKVENDTLYVVCIKDKKEKTIFNFMADMVKISTDLPASSQSMKLLTSLIKDYIPALPATLVSEEGWSTTVACVEHHFNVSLRSFPIFSPPPEFAA
jgi:hypothetical protein